MSLGPCWLWTGCLSARGYGRKMLNGKVRNAHRYVYELLAGPIPRGLELDHLCRKTSCVNPAHLEPVTHLENMRRGDHRNVSRHNKVKTHCPQGHPYDDANTYRHGNQRRCRVCNGRSQNARYHRLNPSAPFLGQRKPQKEGY